MAHVDYTTNPPTLVDVWHAEDIRHQVGEHLTDQEVIDIMELIVRRHDASIGISWDVIEIHADSLGYAAPEGIPIEELTPELARMWLIDNDKEGADFWRDYGDHGLVEAVLEDLESFGYENQLGDITIRSPK